MRATIYIRKENEAKWREILSSRTATDWANEMIVFHEATVNRLVNEAKTGFKESDLAKKIFKDAGKAEPKVEPTNDWGA